MIDTACILEQGLPICNHISHFYPERITGNPSIFMFLKMKQDGLKQQTTETGDICHYNIIDLSDKECRQILKEKSLSDFSICSSTGLRPLTLTDLTL